MPAPAPDATPVSEYAPKRALTQWQVSEALRLARSFGHAWACLHDTSDEQLVAWLADGDTAAIAAAAIAENVGQPGGIAAPAIGVDADGDTVVTHVTGTGRLVWKIGRSVTCYDITRPGGAVVLRAIVDAEGINWRIDGEAYPRHLSALEDAVGAECGDVRVIDRVAYWAGHEADLADREAAHLESQAVDARERAAWVREWLAERGGAS